MTKFRKSLYFYSHILTPLTYLVVGFAWGHFVLETPIWINLTDNLSIVALYYFGITILWYFFVDKIEIEYTKARENAG